MVKETATEIDHDAAAWMARFDRGLTPPEEEQLQAWLDADDRHLGAFARMRALSSFTQRSAGLGPDYRPELFRNDQHRDNKPLDEPAPAARVSRRRFLTLSAATLGTAAAATGIFLFMRPARFSTRTGEVRSLALADGSVLTLNTASTAQVRYSRNRREIRLLGGEAFFEVAKDASRPFFVSAAQLQIKVVGTVFGVKLVPSHPAQVLVQEGIVEAHANAASGAQPVRLTANMRGVVTADAPVATSTVSLAELQRQFAWREGRIIFEGDSLATASAEFARYSDTRIVIDDPELAREEVSGSYQANDPVGFGRAIAEALRVRAVVADGEVRLLR